MPKDIPIFIGIIPQRVNQSLLDIVVYIPLLGNASSRDSSLGVETSQDAGFKI